MELFPPLSEFYNTVANDARIGTSHISLYMAFLQCWNLNGGNNPITIERDAVMKAAKISSRQTYNQCINDLHQFGYIIYKPSVNASVQTKVTIQNRKNDTQTIPTAIDFII